MELEQAEVLQNECIEVVKYHGVKTYSSDDENWFRLGRRQLSGYPAIGIGLAEDGYKISVFIQRQTKIDNDLIRQLIKEGGENIDIQYIDPVYTFYRRVRPPEMGISVSHFKSLSGTLGCFVQRRDSNDSSKFWILSNNHVIANDNDARIGEAVIQPGRNDRRRWRKGGKRIDREDTIASLDSWIKLEPRGNTVDAAIAEVNVDVKEDTINVIPGIGRISSIYTDRIIPALKVKKLGRTTGLTDGIVTTILKKELEVTCKRNVKRGFCNVIVIESSNNKPFSKKGDSGSIIVDEQNRAMGLLFAGNGTQTFAIPATEVFDKLNLRLPDL